MMRARAALVVSVLVSLGGVALAADGAKADDAMTVTSVVSIASALVGGLAIAVGMLYRELAKGRAASEAAMAAASAVAAKRIASLEEQLDAEREESAKTARANTAWALEVQTKVYETIEKNATIAEALLQIQRTRR